MAAASVREMARAHPEPGAGPAHRAASWSRGSAGGMTGASSLCRASPPSSMSCRSPSTRRTRAAYASTSSGRVGASVRWPIGRRKTRTTTSSVPSGPKAPLPTPAASGAAASSIAARAVRRARRPLAPASSREAEHLCGARGTAADSDVKEVVGVLRPAVGQGMVEAEVEPGGCQPRREEPALERPDQGRRATHGVAHDREDQTHEVDRDGDAGGSEHRFRNPPRRWLAGWWHPNRSRGWLAGGHPGRRRNAPTPPSLLGGRRNRQSRRPPGRRGPR